MADGIIFNEVYGGYYNAVAEILKYAVNGELDEKKLDEIVCSKAFSESVLSLEDNLLSGDLPFITDGFETDIIYEPEMPLTLIQKRWIKSMLMDKRVRLFLSDDEIPSYIKTLGDVEPLFLPENIVFFDRYSDGDPYDDKNYIGNFRKVLKAIKTGNAVELEYTNKFGMLRMMICRPVSFEYSKKDDKFRINAIPKDNDEWQDTVHLNMSRIIRCRETEDFEVTDVRTGPKQNVILELKDTENTLERALIYFSYLEKRTERVSTSDNGDIYRMTLYYDRRDETELLVRILSFGPNIRVTSPEDFKSKIRDRITRQKELFSSQLFFRD